MTQEEAQSLVKKHGNKKEASIAAGISRTTFCRILDGVSCAGKKVLVVSTKPFIGIGTSIAARSVTDFRNTYDMNTIVPKKIAAGFKQLGAGWLYESEFAKSAGLTMKDLGNFRDNYAEHIVVVKEGRRVWAGKKTVAEQMRQMI